MRPLLTLLLLVLAGTLALPASGEDTREIDTWLRATAVSLDTRQGPPLERRLAGIYLDRREVNTQMILWQPQEFWLPYHALLQDLQLTPVRRDAAVLISTPGGEVSIEPGELYLYQGQLYISRSTLEQKWHIETRFDPTRYGVVLHLPWWRSGDVDPALAYRPLVPDFSAPDFALGTLRIDQRIRAAENEDTSYFTELTSTGRLFDGVWRVEMDKAPGSEVMAQEYYWISARDRTQWLLGNQTTTLHPLVPGGEFTGVQSAWSNERFPDDYHRDISRNSFTRSLGVPVKDIAGQARPGSIAELVIDGRTVAFTRVRLDGNYDFNSVEMPGRQFNRVIVRIRRSTSGATLEEQDFSGINSQLLVGSGRHIVYSGAGVRGDPLSPHYSGTESASLAQWRYGVTDGLTIEALYQSLNDQDYALLGTTSQLGQSWLFSASLANNQDGDAAYMWETTGFGDSWQFRHLSREYEAGFRSNPQREFLHDADIRHTPVDWFTWGLVGRREQSESRDIDFVKPGGQLRLGRNTSLSVWPNYEGEQRLDFRSYLGPAAGQVTYSYEDEDQELDYRRDLDGGQTFYATTTKFRERVGRLESGFQWFPDDADNRSRLVAAGIVNEDSEWGYLLQWDRLVIPGLFSRLEIRDEPEGRGVASPGLLVNWTLTLDLSFDRWRPRPGDSNRMFNRAGAISGKLLLPDRDQLPAEKIDRVSVTLDGYTHTSPLEGGYFHLGNLRAGTYRMRLDAEHLPLEVVPEQRSYVVEVASGAVTGVQLSAHLEYSASGRVVDEHDTPVAGARIEVTGADGFVRTVTADQFGLYRVDGLTPGVYNARVLAVTGATLIHSDGRAIEISGDFVFGLDIGVKLKKPSPGEP